MLSFNAAARYLEVSNTSVKRLCKALPNAGLRIAALDLRVNRFIERRPRVVSLQRSRATLTSKMKTLDDVVAELQKQGERHTRELEKHTQELERHTEVLDELLDATSEIRTSQLALTNAVTQLVTQLQSDQRALERRVAQVEEDVRALKGSH